jgi:predicted PurR-regulated permease PerM
MLNLKTTFFSISFLALALLLSVLLYDVALLFLFSYLIAYMLEPIVAKLSAVTGSRGASLTIVFLVFWGVVVTLFIFLSPILYQQGALFISKVPKYKLYVQNNLMPYLAEQVEAFDKDFLKYISALLETLTSRTLNFVFSIFNNVWNYTLATMNVIIFIILLPVISFYFLKDKKTLQEYQNRINLFLDHKVVLFILDCFKIIAQFIKGQLEVCLIMACYYSLTLMLIGLDFSLLLGLISGFSVAIPFLGIFVSLLLTSVVSIVSFGISYNLLYVALLYLVGQFLEGYIISPRIIGGKIGLHPLVIIFSLFLWGKLLGVLGLFIAIPITCILKVLFRNLSLYL